MRINLKWLKYTDINSQLTWLNLFYSQSLSSFVKGSHKTLILLKTSIEARGKLDT